MAFGSVYGLELFSFGTQPQKPARLADHDQSNRFKGQTKPNTNSDE